MNLLLQPRGLTHFPFNFSCRRFDGGNFGQVIFQFEYEARRIVRSYKLAVLSCDQVKREHTGSIAIPKWQAAQFTEGTFEPAGRIEVSD
jgi:hypothetical protein